ncbi:Bro-N domain-containing protein [Acidithiobacillus ferrooxidans]|uniref:BRO family protein n=1 Tax=Acidithiobacillus ferrooxidans (strain ATCC 23270 / DSM 14882 / CIP 104768 / NCIMB 8455) TaxID=243159 RepID=B7J821_ACIF2|nr:MULTISPECIES: Bro-N domain-containing protein [Acidithiobacillus]ACK78068.1 BRO family protein [Acidithiobacillus ferrooxidans ATCC 23270]MBN6744932.1 Bro-N domain-containing protein [Acidithiobacillus sp. MC2.2]MBN6747884.1 Bro-N domain-containing protein [Acidithiobacillus sp. PG05]
MQNVIPFEYEGRDIRVIPGENGEPWWVAVDVCRALGLVDASVAMRKLDEDEKTTLCLTPGHVKQGLSDNAPGTSLNLVNEPGLYRLILTSRKPEAHAFKRWVTHEVLPMIRKTGKYETSPAQPKYARFADVDWPAVARMHAAYKRVAKSRKIPVAAQVTVADLAVELLIGVPLRAIISDAIAQLGDLTEPTTDVRTKAGPSEHVAIDSIQETDVRLSPEATLNVSDLGALLGGYTGIAFNRLLYGLGYQVRHTIRGKSEWHPTEKGTPFAVKIFVPRTGGRGADVPQLLWKAGILDALRAEPAVQKNFDPIKH